MLALLLLVFTSSASPQPLLEPGHGQHLQPEEGSGCLYEDGNYFDFIEVDDEDYVVVEEGSAQSEESVRRGPPVFTDYPEESFLLKMSTFGGEENETLFKDSSELNDTPRDGLASQIVPETLVITNQTHASLNGRLTITNRQSHQEPVSELFFDDEIIHSEQEEDGETDIAIYSKSFKISNSISTALVCRFILLL